MEEHYYTKEEYKALKREEFFLSFWRNRDYMSFITMILLACSAIIGLFRYFDFFSLKKYHCVTNRMSFNLVLFAIILVPLGLFIIYRIIVKKYCNIIAGVGMALFSVVIQSILVWKSITIVPTIVVALLCLGLCIGSMFLFRNKMDKLNYALIKQDRDADILAISDWQLLREYDISKNKDMKKEEKELRKREIDEEHQKMIRCAEEIQEDVIAFELELEKKYHALKHFLIVEILFICVFAYAFSPPFFNLYSCIIWNQKVSGIVVFCYLILIFVAYTIFWSFVGKSYMYHNALVISIMISGALVLSTWSVTYIWVVMLLYFLITIGGMYGLNFINKSIYAI